MKFLRVNKINFFKNPINDYFSDIHQNQKFYSIYYNFEKSLVKKRKNLYKTKLGVSINVKKNSIKRDSNNILSQQYINLGQKKGNKNSFKLNFDKAIENLYTSFKLNLKEFSSYDNYLNFSNIFNNSLKHSNIDYIIYEISNNLKSVFEIKTKKNNKKLKLQSKYSHEIVYIPRQKRLKYVLRAICLYKEYFNNYCLWERIFWSIFITIVNKKNSFLMKRKNFIYEKSIKFFKK